VHSCLFPFSSFVSDFSSRALQRAIDAELPNCLKRSRKAIQSTFINGFAVNESGGNDDDSSYDPCAVQEEEETEDLSRNSEALNDGSGEDDDETSCESNLNGRGRFERDEIMEIEEEDPDVVFVPFPVPSKSKQVRTKAKKTNSKKKNKNPQRTGRFSGKPKKGLLKSKIQPPGAIRRPRTKKRNLPLKKRAGQTAIQSGDSSSSYSPGRNLRATEVRRTPSGLPIW